MSDFDQEMVVHVRHVNPRNEIHGEDTVLGIDVSLRVVDGDFIDQSMMPLLLSLQHGGFEAWKLANAAVIDSVNLAASYIEHRIEFRTDDDEVVLVKAKLNKFRFAFDDVGLTLRVQAECDGATAGALCELMGQKVLMSATSSQLSIDFGEDGDAPKAQM